MYSEVLLEFLQYLMIIHYIHIYVYISNEIFLIELITYFSINTNKTVTICYL